MSSFPTFKDDQSVVCFNCKLPVTGPFQASGHADGYGAMRGQCTGPRGCERVTYFDFAKPLVERTYVARFIGKTVGAIGKPSRFEVTVKGFDEDGARFALYETHEHIEDLKLEVVSS